MWNEILTEEDMCSFMSLFGHFHDSCIKEIKYISGAFVSANLSMNPMNDKRIVDMVFQRQYKNPTVIVMRFIGLNMLHLAPYDDNYTCEIHKATIFNKNECFYWADCHIAENDINNYEGTWVCAEKILWRIIDECVGSDEVFKSKFDL